MELQVLKSKIHAFITEVNIEYVGSITIDEDLMNAVDLIEGEQVYVINHRNNVRLITYVITGKRGTGEICMNSSASFKIRKWDKIIIIAYARMSKEEYMNFKSKLFSLNTITNYKS